MLCRFLSKMYFYFNSVPRDKSTGFEPFSHLRCSLEQMRTYLSEQLRTKADQIVKCIFKPELF